ncbi:LOW QUALITY PROTEIN: protein BNIP5 [Loxodonta africana]|uniref:LOW QUALITY PROTEIN: protein BNIP5 n=1 Tax=Loxodonta africana TaxID=9785 RepID=UPI0030CB1548
MENSQDLRKPLPKRRTRSLERSQDPRKDSESWDCPCLSLHSTYSKKELRRTSSDGAGCFQSLAQPAEAQGTMATALSLEETNKPIRSEQSSPQDTKKDKAHRRAQPGLLKVLFNFFLRTSPEEPKDKASRRPKRKESLSQPVESPVAPGQPAVRKKSQDKKPSRKKASGHKKHVTEETKGVQDQEAASHPEESDLGPARKGKHWSGLGEGDGWRQQPVFKSKPWWGPEFLVKPRAGYSFRVLCCFLMLINKVRRISLTPPSSPPQTLNSIFIPGRENPDLPECLFTEGRCAGVQTDSSQATGHKWEAERQLSEDAIIQMIVELIKKIGDEWEEEVRSKPSVQVPRSSLPLLLTQTPLVLLGLAPAPPPLSPPHPSQLQTSVLPGLWALLPPFIWGPTVALWLFFLREISLLLRSGALIQFLSSPPQRLRTQQLETGLQNQAPVFRKKSQEKKSSFRRAFILKKQGSEEPKRVGAADVPSLETRTPKRPSFLPLCVGGHRPSTSSSTDLEEPQVPDVRSPTALKITPGARSRWPEEELEPDRASESKEFTQRIFALLQDAEEQGTQKRLQTQQPEVDVENPASIFRKKSQEKKSSFRRAFIYKKQSSKESKRVGAADVSSPEARTPKRPSFLPLCVGGQRPSVPDLDLEDIEFQKLSPAERGPIGSPEPASQTRSHKPEGEPQLEGACESKEQVIQKLVALLQKVDNQLGKQIRRHPSFETFLYKLSDSSVTKLIATLQSREAHPPEPDKSLDERRYQFAASLANKFAGNNSHVICLLGHYSWHLYPWFPYEEAQLVRKGGNDGGNVAQETGSSGIPFLSTLLPSLSRTLKVLLKCYLLNEAF